MTLTPESSVNLHFLEEGAVKAARDLIGWRLYAEQPDGTLVGGVILETEAYTMEDAASHSYKGETARTKVMFGPSGHLYVYFTYGMHYCLNIVTGEKGVGEAVLVRALKIDEGVDVARQRRNRPDAELANGPAKICQALGVNLADNGQELNGSRMKLLPPLKKYKIETTMRIGITKDKDRPWRFTATA